ncbi:putative T6SS immunity periplasmic lipoprotein [Serratia plymuthica]|uniref:putative T6SS immunity periplasmic lipoprotein n=1 Tax=Serratia plymuthica TaxID=82996 RepID=UPI001F243D0B|nr:putative T6SS immunity periplasmic lipoprotein [Serratia plymuthica]
MGKGRKYFFETGLDFNVMMMRIIVLLTSAALLSGCMHMNDPRPKNYTANVTTFDNQVCVLVQPEGDERLSGVIIEEFGSATHIFGKNFTDNKMPAVASDKCIPDFNYKFEDGKSYRVSVTLLSQDKRRKGIEPAARVFGAGFGVRNDNGVIKVTPTN